MTDTATIKRQIADFSAAYDYDASYLAGLVDASPGAYAAFAAAQPLGQFRATLPLEAHWVAAVSTMQAEDCGACLQLSLKRAVQEGIDRARLRQVLDAPETLPSLLADIRSLARGVCEGAPDDLERAERLRAAYGDAGVAELAVCITGCRIYPTLKRALSKMGVCQRPSLDF